MPTHEYACQSCGHDMEVFQRMSDDPLEQCPSCNTPSLKRKIGLGAGIIFKGGGFYETDFKEKKGSASSTSSESTGKAEKKDTKPAKNATSDS